jgi:hypothetical protein
MAKRRRSKDNDDDSALAETYLQHELMNETKAYLDRGRRFARLDVTQLADRWIAVFKAYFAQHYRKQGNEMDDLAAELRLRGLDPPFEAVSAEISKLQESLKRLGSNAKSPELDRKITDFLEQRRKPKH